MTFVPLQHQSVHVNIHRIIEPICGMPEPTLELMAFDNAMLRVLKLLIAIIVTTHPDAVKKTAELELINRIGQGDKQAFETLFRSYQPRIYRYVSRMIQSNELIDEVTCDALYAVWTSAKSFKGNSAVSTWVFGIARMKALKAIDKDSRHRQLRADADHLDTLSEENPTSDPENTTADHINSKVMARALGELSEDHRSVVELTALGHSCAEIADIVDCPRNTVKTRMFHARKHLQKWLSENHTDLSSEL